MEDREAQPIAEQPEQESPVAERRPWQQPKLERLHVSLDTTNSPGSITDANGPTCGC